MKSDDVFKLLDIFEKECYITSNNKLTRSFCACCGTTHEKKWYKIVKTSVESYFYYCVNTEKVRGYYIDYYRNDWSFEFETIYEFIRDLI